MRGQIYDDATFGAHFAITVSGPAMVQFVSTEFGNQPDPYVSDSAHIKDPGGTTTYTTVQGVPKVILTECANKLLKAELINVNKITDTERIYIKVFDADISDLDQFPATATNLSAAIVSNGNPIVDITESIYNAVLDGSESYTRESNIGIGNYYFTTGRTETLQGPFPLQSQNTDTYGVSDSLGSTATTVPQLSVSYTNNNIRHLLDANSRFLDYSMLCRLQVADNHTKITGSGDVSNKRSWIEHYNDDQYVSTVNSGVLKAPTSLQSRAMIAVSNSDTPKVAHWYDVDVEKYLNTSSYILLGGNTDWESSGDSSIKGTADTADPRSMTNVPKNFIFIAKSDLFDKLYLDLKNTYTPSASPIDIDITAYYSHADGWKPLNITDETQRLQTNGLITWDIPNDWASTTASGVESGNWSGPIKANSVPAS